MCRFLIAKAKKGNLVLDTLLFPFAHACKNSIAPDGASQEDGYGIAWQEKNSWQQKKSLAPIWEDQDAFKLIPKTSLLVSHARSVGFLKDKDSIDYNQPFINDSLCFVFNGMIRKISLTMPLEGKIGSQKLFSLVQKTLQTGSLEEVLRKVNNIVLENAGKVEAMNIGIVKDNQIQVLCQYAENEDYFSLHVYEDADVILVSSEPFGSYAWTKMKKGEIKIFD